MLLISKQILQTVVNFQNFEVPEVQKIYRVLQTGLLLIDSVFVVLVAYFDETMDSIGVY